MDALILSCGTGGGHNAAGEAIREELVRRGDRARVLNPYSLISERRVRQIDNAYISLAQRAPKGFGVVYRLGELYRQTGHCSPVYFLNHKTALALADYLRSHPADVLICPHLFPAEVVTQMKDHGLPVPPSIFVATDYACIPFTEETRCDAYVIPHRDLTDAFTTRGIPADKLYPLGIPTSLAFQTPLGRVEARRELGLEPQGRYFLLSGGSMGAGRLRPAAERLLAETGGQVKLAVICGSNERLYRSLQAKGLEGLLLLRKTQRMACWLRACDVYFTKPGGLSSTEAAVAGVPLVHLPPIPGCETENARFFRDRGMSLAWPQGEDQWPSFLSQLDDPAMWRSLTARQRTHTLPQAAARIGALAHRLSGADGPAQETKTASEELMT